MRALSSSGLLALWEQGFGLHPLDQALLALTAALPEVPPETLADWPLGQRNQALINLHRACFSSRLQAWASCNRCGEKMEFDLDAAALAGEKPGDRCDETIIKVKGHSFRVPTTRDLAQVVRQGDTRRAALCLLERCRLDGGESPAWSDDDVEAIGEAMAEADPLAETRIALRCTSCSSQWDEALDLGAFLWAEIGARVKRLLWEVHTLASVYGWMQDEILSLSEARRSAYIEMVRA